MSKTYFVVVLFNTRPLICQAVEHPLPVRRYVRGWVLGWAGEIDSDISSLPPSPKFYIGFTEMKNCEIWPPFSTSVTFQSPSFRNGAATYLKPKWTPEMSMIDRCLIHFRALNCENQGLSGCCGENWPSEMWNIIGIFLFLAAKYRLFRIYRGNSDREY